ncbi:tyrosine-type recombinase/integrase [Halalkalibacter sp. APA_J-10(15)]|uniref:tyrosine-type recombinase/integrase n=1 Tax=Halalkalibacter sp. APA_J-10(15) TaxID=2933805 RepID=UPI001FF35A27|nr:tyrosine-type recombinase/integrase [Halalkalibacter sp. APA_J-10(15)]MCK0470858.1 tyrosine-type recombinase/integrase [Halalkalibacter sp. APA_J-10(15)]
MLLSDLLLEYAYDNIARGHTEKTLINKKQEFKQLQKFLHEKRAITQIESITTHDLKAYIRHKQQQGLQPQSIVSMAKIIKAFFNWCVIEEYLTANPMDKVLLPKVPKKVLSGFTPEEVTKMIDSFSYKNYIEARNKTIIALLSDCGLRSMELRGLKNHDVTETSILVNGKGNKQRIVFISPVLKKFLLKYERIKKEHFEKRLVKSDHYFLTYKAEQMSHVALFQLVKEAGRRAGIEGKRVSPHVFRHFYTVQTLNSGTIDLYSLSKLLGHSQVSTTQRYLASMTDEELEIKAMTSSPLSNLNKNKRRN